MGSQPEQDQNVYDYVICGYAFFEDHFTFQGSNTTLSGGTAGCVLAGRLAEDPGLSILLVEAGPPNEKVPASAIPPRFVISWFPRSGADSCSKHSTDHRHGSGLEYQERTVSPTERSPA